MIVKLTLVFLFHTKYKKFSGIYVSCIIILNIHFSIKLYINQKGKKRRKKKQFKILIFKNTSFFFFFYV